LVDAADGSRHHLREFLSFTSSIIIIIIIIIIRGRREQVTVAASRATDSLSRLHNRIHPH
jgi:hypothetical protein